MRTNALLLSAGVAAALVAAVFVGAAAANTGAPVFYDARYPAPATSGSEGYEVAEGADAPPQPGGAVDEPDAGGSPATTPDATPHPSTPPSPPPPGDAPKATPQPTPTPTPAPAPDLRPPLTGQPEAPGGPPRSPTPGAPRAERGGAAGLARVPAARARVHGGRRTGVPRLGVVESGPRHRRTGSRRCRPTSRPSSTRRGSSPSTAMPARMPTTGGRMPAAGATPCTSRAERTDAARRGAPRDAGVDQAGATSSMTEPFSAAASARQSPTTDAASSSSSPASDRTRNIDGGPASGFPRLQRPDRRPIEGRSRSRASASTIRSRP